MEDNSKIDLNKLCNDFLDYYLEKHEGHLKGTELEAVREVFQFLQTKI